MHVRDQIVRMLRIQALVVETQAARAVVDGAPGRVEEIEGRFRERNAEYVAIKERHDAIETDRAARSEEMETLEDSRKQFMDSLMQVKNQREYAAALKEVDVVKMRISENEDAILKAMEELATLGTDIEARAEHIAAERESVARELADVEATVAAANEMIAKWDGERAGIETELSPALVQSIRRIEDGRRGVFLVEVDREMCSACHVRVRPQVYQEIRQAVKIHACGSCKRFLYHRSVTEAPAVQNTASETAAAQPSEQAASPLPAAELGTASLPKTEPAPVALPPSGPSAAPHPPSPSAAAKPPAMEAMNGGTV